MSKTTCCGLPGADRADKVGAFNCRYPLNLGFSLSLCAVLWLAGCQSTPSPAISPGTLRPTTLPVPSGVTTVTLTPSPTPEGAGVSSFNHPTRFDIALIAYSDRDGDNEIYHLDCSSGEIRQLTDNKASDSYPSWSPDRERIVFVSDRDGDPEIYLMEADGSNPEQLTDNLEPDTFPSWSPDSENIAFFSRQEGVDNLWIMNIFDRSLRPLTDFEDGKGGAIAFSPRGEKIFFGYERMQKYKIYMADLPEGTPREIIAHASPESRLTCISDPDGLALLYVSGTGTQEDIWLSYIEDGRFRHITKNTAPDHSPTLTPDGENVVFSSQRDGDNWQLYAVSREGKAAQKTVRRLTNDTFNYHYPDVK
ncbi:MAG: DPP IV N-terminal domain-containing protein [Candidatus Euphemobacter frigidus]|nr:DPP IV N-terminal domain-containing protein [Candidatus Euphemobacter frigidus]MDP8276169.1 DPP IV N-terminal domain-containing protein [Candidatus Euphemobacter frigidus]